MFKNEEYSPFLTRSQKIKFTILLIYKLYTPISTFRVSYKATTLLRVRWFLSESGDCLYLYLLWSHMERYPPILPGPFSNSCIALRTSLISELGEDHIRSIGSVMFVQK